MYLTYEIYKEMGGTLLETAYKRYEYKAAKIVDTATNSRVNKMKVVPESVINLVFELIEYLSTCSAAVQQKQSSNQSTGSVSQSESYVVKTQAENDIEIDEMVFEYLSQEYDDNGIPLLFRGAT